MPAELTFDVRAAVAAEGVVDRAGERAGQRAEIHAWSFEPAQAPRAVLLAVPGGTYTKDYWHLRVPGRPNYSFAEHLASSGYAVVAIDNLGTGRSARPATGDRATLAAMAAANAAVAAAVRARWPGRPLIGVGHSMGAALVLRQQATFRSFDAVCALGYGYEPLAGMSAPGAGVDLLGESAALFADYPCTDGYYTPDRNELRPRFHLDDVPGEVIDADDRLATVLPRAALHEVAATPLGRGFAQVVDVPILQAWGEQDNTPDPHAEGRHFTACPDYTLFVLPGSAHCHNLATTRQLLWRRIVRWLDSLDGISPDGVAPNCVQREVTRPAVSPPST